MKPQEGSCDPMQPFLRRLPKDLPLGVARLLALVLVEIFAIVAGGLCLKIWTKHHKWQVLLNEHLPTGVSATLEYNDVKTTSIVLFVTTHLVTVVVGKSLLLIVHDIFGILPKFVLRRLPNVGEPLSSYTLPHQATALFFSVVFLFIAAAFHMNVVFNRSGTVAFGHGSTELPSSDLDLILRELGISLPYKDVEYIRVSGELAPPAVLFGIIAVVVTIVAWHRHRKVDAGLVESEIEKNIVVDIIGNS
ncbi:hypothetical protein MIND_00618500 [Mycena indigotica]|uniref:Uncharacterized protein n=1 Tax=Mycena indigotica TaxID=2126181 RepID=A0A8H6W360_9AGAR|nr:uncharacterized protein MIND_00618500 [Mycena indigotica]KAF7303884.1 hypothetical protein MIND_00618500 [Mycena indigotica]